MINLQATDIVYGNLKGIVCMGTSHMYQPQALALALRPEIDEEFGDQQTWTWGDVVLDRLGHEKDRQSQQKSSL